MNIQTNNAEISSTRIVRSEFFLLFCAAFASIALSFILISQNPNINPDGILYLRLAELFKQTGWRGLLSDNGLYGWPYFSLLIATVSQLFHLSTYHAAQLCNILLQIGCVVAWLKIIKLCGGGLRTQWLGLLVFLSWPSFNNYREYIIRDYGYYCFYLTSIYCLLRYVGSRRLTQVALLYLSLLAASLFRIEGAVFFLLVPLVAIVLPEQRIKHFLTLSIIPLFCLSILGLFVLTQQTSANASLSRLYETKELLIHATAIVQNNFFNPISRMQQVLPYSVAARSLPLIIGLGLFAFFLVKVVKVLGVFYFALLGYGLVKKAFPINKAQQRVLLFSTLLSAAICLVFLYLFFFLSARYVLALELILLLPVPFALDKLWQAKHKMLIVIALAMLYLLADSLLDFGYSKAYIKQAGQWLNKNTTEQSQLLTNSAQVLFYAKGATSDWEQSLDVDLIRTQAGQWNQFDYMAIRLKRKDQFSLLASQQPVKQFGNRRGDRVLIYQVKKP